MRIPIALVLTLFAAGSAAAAPADLVLKNGVIHTLDDAQPRAKAVAITRDRLSGLSMGAPDPSWIGPRTRVIDLGGACVVPGLWDAHAHLLSLGLVRTRVDLRGTESFAQVIERVKERAARTPKGQWVLASGWDQNDWPKAEFGGELPTHHSLSKAVPDHPVRMSRIDGHALLLNARAMKACGLTSASRSPEGGEILRDERGRPTGVLVDAAMALAGSAGSTRLSAAQRRDTLRLAAAECLRLGLVGIHDAGVSIPTLEAYDALYRNKRLPFRIYAMLTPGAAERLMSEGPQVLHGGRLTVRAIKRFMDGALGSRGAYLLAPYSDRPKVRGLPQTTVAKLARDTRRALDAGFQTCTHAIGDGGVRRVLDAYERALADRRGDSRLRVEHAQVIAPADFDRFARLGILPSMQPTHATSDMPWAEARLGKKRARGAYAWRRLLKAKVAHIPLGSDFPVEAPNPLLGIYAAVTRLTPDGKSPHGPGGWFPDQRLTRLEALRGFTRDACYAAFQERDGGTIAVGKWADLSVFDRDILSCPARELLKAKVRLTIVAGQVAYDSKG